MNLVETFSLLCLTVNNCGDLLNFYLTPPSGQYLKTPNTLVNEQMAAKLMAFLQLHLCFVFSGNFQMLACEQAK